MTGALGLLLLTICIFALGAYFDTNFGTSYVARPAFVPEDQWRAIKKRADIQKWLGLVLVWLGIVAARMVGSTGSLHYAGYFLAGAGFVLFGYSRIGLITMTVRKRRR